MVMEFSIGRASKQNIGLALKRWNQKAPNGIAMAPIAMIGNYVLMMFYTTISGWLLSYFIHMVKGDFTALDATSVQNFFTAMLASPKSMFFWMTGATVLGFLPVARGLQKGVEKISKFMMVGLLGLIVVLALNSLTLTGGGEGLAFYLLPNFSRMKEIGIFEAIYAAMGQAFFTLSPGDRFHFHFRVVH